ncbi:MAG: ABC transporter ATP-binding protein [Polyangiaceae bacterium]|nr:ABC transporter ATP-binding protein [Polyangiaceae bacterium]
MIQIRGLYKYYGPSRAIGPLDVEVQAGQVVGLLGENGAGKTTTLRILACDLLPSAGQVMVDGYDVVDHPDEVRARVGYLPDKPPLYPEMTVREFLVFAARLKGVSKGDVQKRVNEAAEQTGIAARLDQVIGTLSHGFQQRVGIAQAIVHRPKFVVLDEPISGLDPRQIVEMRHLIRGLAGDHTVLISSHILSEISQTCDRLLVIRDGTIVADDSEAAIVNRTLGGMRLSLLVSGLEVDALRSLLQDLEAVEIVELGKEGKALRAELRTQSDQRASIARRVVEAGAELLELGRSEHELESVFMRLAEGSAYADGGRSRQGGGVH